MPTHRRTPIRTLPDRPNLSQLKHQAKDLLKAFVAADPAAVAEIEAHYHDAHPDRFTLTDAQLVLARAYGFESWPRLRAYVDGVTIQRVIDGIRAGDIDGVTTMLRARPELVHLQTAEDDEQRALHHAVLARHPEMVRLLMRHGADARVGVWPHRDATSALTIASERGYSDIVAIILEEEGRRSGASTTITPPPAPVVDAFEQGDEAAVISFLEAHPEVVSLVHPNGMTPLHFACVFGRERLARWLVEHGADVTARTTSGRTPLDVIGLACDAPSPDERLRLTAIGDLLLRRGAERTARWAIWTGDVQWLRTATAAGTLAREVDLVSVAVLLDQPAVLDALLELGFDPDERQRVADLEEVVLTWGAPLRECARLGRAALAESLLRHGANPNTAVYAASSALYEAHQRGDGPMVALLESHGAVLDAPSACYLGLVARAEELFRAGAGESDDDHVASFLQAAADCGQPDLVRLALTRVDWTAGDRRWQWMLMRPLGRHEAEDRARFVACFRLVLERSDLKVPWKGGRTPLHDVAANWPRSAPMGPDDRVAFAEVLLSHGARLDARDALLKSTPLGWACRWGHEELVRLLLDHGADPREADAEAWATPLAWAERGRHQNIAGLLRASSESKAARPPERSRE